MGRYLPGDLQEKGPPQSRMSQSTTKYKLNPRASPRYPRIVGAERLQLIAAFKLFFFWISVLIRTTAHHYFSSPKVFKINEAVEHQDHFKCFVKQHFHHFHTFRNHIHVHLSFWYFYFSCVLKYYHTMKLDKNIKGDWTGLTTVPLN